MNLSSQHHHTMQGSRGPGGRYTGVSEAGASTSETDFEPSGVYSSENRKMHRMLEEKLLKGQNLRTRLDFPKSKSLPIVMGTFVSDEVRH